MLLAGGGVSVLVKWCSTRPFHSVHFLKFTLFSAGPLVGQCSVVFGGPPDRSVSGVHQEPESLGSKFGAPKFGVRFGGGSVRTGLRTEQGSLLPRGWPYYVRSDQGIATDGAFVRASRLERNKDATNGGSCRERGPRARLGGTLHSSAEVSRPFPSPERLEETSGVDPSRPKP